MPEEKPLISIIIPIFNDEITIPHTIEKIADFLKQNNTAAEIIIVNDGGKDNGVQIVQEKMVRFPWIKLINHEINKGKGYAIREGLKKAQGDFIFYTDADLPYSTEPIKKMLAILKMNQADLILANRELIYKNTGEKLPLLRRVIHRIYPRFVKIFMPFEFNDMFAGLKGMRKNVAQKMITKLTIDRFSFDIELLLIAKLAGFKIQEFPVSLQNVGKSNLSILKDTPQIAKDIIKIFFRYKRGFYN